MICLEHNREVGFYNGRMDCLDCIAERNKFNNKFMVVSIIGGVLTALIFIVAYYLSYGEIDLGGGIFFGIFGGFFLGLLSMPFYIK